MGLKQKLKLDWIWLKLSYPFRWAHHPTCDPYSDQRFEISIGSQTIHLCQGCSLVTIGAVISFLGVALWVILGNALTLPWFAVLTLLPVIPVAIIDGKHLDRPFKRIARLLLGHSTGLSLAFIFFYPNWTAKISIILLLYGAKLGYEKLRYHSPSKDLCQTCDLLDEAPYCPGMIDKMEANKQYQELALPVLDSSIRQQVAERYEAPASVTEEVETNSGPKPHDTNFDIVWVDDSN